MLTRCLILALLLISDVGCVTFYRRDISLAQNLETSKSAIAPGVGSAIAATPQTALASHSIAKSTDKNMAFDLNSYQWQNRLLLVFAPSENSPAYQRQMQLFQAQQANFPERDLLLVEILTEGASRVLGKALDEADVAKVRSRFHVSPQDFRVILVGKDGTAKRSDSNPVEPKVIFDEIDAMPMRQQEMRHRNRG